MSDLTAQQKAYQKKTDDKVSEQTKNPSGDKGALANYSGQSDFAKEAEEERLAKQGLDATRQEERSFSPHKATLDRIAAARAARNASPTPSPIVLKPKE